MLKQLQSKNSMTFIFLLYHYFTFLSRILIAYIYPSTADLFEINFIKNGDFRLKDS